jgi:hypothetical protein
LDEWRNVKEKTLLQKIEKEDGDSTSEEALDDPLYIDRDLNEARARPYEMHDFDLFPPEGNGQLRNI